MPVIFRIKLNYTLRFFFHKMKLGCFCQSTIANDINQQQKADMAMDSSSNFLDLQLNLDNIYDEAYKDDGLYRFTVDYVWIADRCGRPVDGDQVHLLSK